MGARSFERWRTAGLCAAGALLFLVFDSGASAHVPTPVGAQSASDFSYASKDGQQTVSINNVTFQVLRTVTRTQEVLDGIGIRAASRSRLGRSPPTSRRSRATASPSRPRAPR
jgi:hypothetical protein